MTCCSNSVAGLNAVVFKQVNSCSKKTQILNNDKLAWAHVILFAFPAQSFLESQGFRPRIFYIVQTAHWTCTGAESGDEIWQLIWVDVLKVQSCRDLTYTMVCEVFTFENNKSTVLKSPFHLSHIVRTRVNVYFADSNGIDK